MKKLTQPVDLVRHMRAGVDHIYCALDRARGCVPYFSWWLDPKDEGPAPFAQHTFGGDNPHVTGRFLDALSRCNAIAEMPRDDQADECLARLLHNSFAEDNLAYDDDSEYEHYRGTKSDLGFLFDLPGSGPVGLGG